MRNCNSHNYEYQMFRTVKPSMAYDGSMPFDQWQQVAEGKLMELLGLPLEQCDPMLEVEYTKERDDCTEYRFTVQTEPVYCTDGAGVYRTLLAVHSRRCEKRSPDDLSQRTRFRYAYCFGCSKK